VSRFGPSTFNCVLAKAIDAIVARNGEPHLSAEDISVLSEAAMRIGERGDEEDEAEAAAETEKTYEVCMYGMVSEVYEVRARNPAAAATAASYAAQTDPRFEDASVSWDSTATQVDEA
jgi:hypothetical protein